MQCAAVVSDRIFCMHGGLSPELDSLDKINAIKRPCDIPDFGAFMHTNAREYVAREVRGAEVVRGGRRDEGGRAIVRGCSALRGGSIASHVQATQPKRWPGAGILCDLLWADPDSLTTNWGVNDRGVSFVFGEDIIRQFCVKHDLDLICRAHQVGRRWWCVGGGVWEVVCGRW